MEQSGILWDPLSGGSAMKMTTAQESTLQKLQARIKYKLENTFEYNGDIFTENKGVTRKIGRDGGPEVPALRSYDDAFEAAVNAPTLFRLQQERDGDNPELAHGYTTGHFNPRWDPRTGRCDGSRRCPRCPRGKLSSR